MEKAGFVLRSSLSWIRPAAATLIAYVVLDWNEYWQMAAVFLLTYLMELITVYLSMPSSIEDTDFDEDETGKASKEKKSKLPKIKKKF